MLLISGNGGGSREYQPLLYSGGVTNASWISTSQSEARVFSNGSLLQLYVQIYMLSSPTFAGTIQVRIPELRIKNFSNRPIGAACHWNTTGYAGTIGAYSFGSSSPPEFLAFDLIKENAASMTNTDLSTTDQFAFSCVIPNILMNDFNNNVV